MSEPRIGDEELQRAYRGMGDPTAAGESCPAPEELWSAMHGELPREEALRVLDHLATCGACIGAWQVARGLSDPVAASGKPLRQSPPRWTLAAAAVLVLGLVTVPLLLDRGTPVQSPTRGEQLREIRSEIGAGVSLSRDRCLLEWSAPEGATSYRVDVTTENLDVVFSTWGLSEPQVLIPPEALIAVPPGQRILWRVEATLLDGGRVKSATFSDTVD